MPALRRFLILFAIAFFSGALIYSALSLVLTPYGSSYRMFNYHHEFPLQYWAIQSLAYAIIGTVWLFLFASQPKVLRIVSAVIAVVISVFLASIPGAMLWAYHDMKAGHFLGWPGSFNYMLSWIPSGLQIAGTLLVTSIPFNLITMFFGVAILYVSASRISKIGTQLDH